MTVWKATAAYVPNTGSHNSCSTVKLSPHRHKRTGSGPPFPTDEPLRAAVHGRPAPTHLSQVEGMTPRLRRTPLSYTGLSLWNSLGLCNQSG